MQKFNELVEVVIAELQKRWEHALPQEKFTISLESDRLNVSFTGGRKQQIVVKRRRASYTLTSNVLQRAKVEELGRSNILRAIWTRNRSSRLVGFRLDKSGKVVGYIEHQAESLDPSDLAYCIEVLARECDRLEFVLSGEDIH
jgi:hypothetical protein